MDTRPTADAARIDAIIADIGPLEGPLLPILHQLQAAFGYIPGNAVPILADRLNISRADVHGVVSFYHDFRDAPAGRHVVRLCRSEACQAVGANALAAHAETRLGVAMGETRSDGAVTLAPVYCLGLCACGPAALIDGQPVGRLDADRFDALTSAVRA